MLEVEVTPRAAAQIELAAAWWAENRPAAPDAIRVDFQEADLRRLFLSRVRYHIYYRVRPGKVIVLAFWHASRGTGPSL